MSWGSVYLHRQRHPRVNVKLPVEYSQDADMSPQPSRVNNISEGGLLIIVQENIPAESVISLKIHLPIAFYSDKARITPIYASARVVWTQLLTGNEDGDFHCGVCFTDIPPDDLALLKEFINKCMASESYVKL